METWKSPSCKGKSSSIHFHYCVQNVNFPGCTTVVGGLHPSAKKNWSNWIISHTLGQKEKTNWNDHLGCIEAKNKEMPTYGCFPQMVVPPKHPKMIILAGKPVVVGYHHLGNPHIDPSIYPMPPSCILLCVHQPTRVTHNSHDENPGRNLPQIFMYLCIYNDIYEELIKAVEEVNIPL